MPFFYGLLAQNLFHCIGQGGCFLGVETPGHHGVSLGTGQIRLIPHIQGGQGLCLLRAQSLKGDIRVRWYGFRVSTSIFSFIHIGVPRRDKGGFARFGVDELILLDFSSLISQAAESFDVLANANQVPLSLQVAPGAFVTGDADSLRQLVSILMENAIKYAGPGGKVVVHLDKQGKSLCFWVENTCTELPLSLIHI